ncbi:hypothetical protein [Aquisalinus flavus]|uniref:hypothetical protein n=1 Tax=Aquisalinus flavus TaxID=1526572 RepID=UPI00165ECD74|nr:hypothetical protein [Aquisalinus flavus]MBD0425385.1 hypothetical protein [Aquisalinus flavus]UNE48967.1 hypothetical protein FF099_13380 [Aquisalinus flavus]
MRPKIIIHAGMHKTGTSSLQKMLADRREVLAHHKIWYPGNGVADAAPLLNVKRADWTETALRETLETACRQGAETILFSLESVSTFSEDSFRRLTDALHGYKVLYLFTLRHWATYMPSRWAQYVRRRDSQTLGQYVTAALQGDHIDHRLDLPLARALGSGKCQVRAISYDWASKKPGGVLNAVMRVMGFDDALRTTLLASAEWRHRTPDRAAIETVRLLNGVLSAHMGLPQNDNFHAVLEDRLVDVPFTLPGNAIDRDLAFRIREIGDCTLTDGGIIDWPDAASLLEDYRGCFPGLADRPFFPPVDGKPLSSWSVEWPAIAGDREVQAFVAGMVPVIEQRLADRDAIVAQTRAGTGEEAGSGTRERLPG